MFPFLPSSLVEIQDSHGIVFQDILDNLWFKFEKAYVTNTIYTGVIITYSYITLENRLKLHTCMTKACEGLM